LNLALEFVRDHSTRVPLGEFSREVSRACCAKGVYLCSRNHIPGIRPPLVITQDQAERVVDVIEEVLRELT
jgi:4-aminobutyrate aminotransferase-like enzyme